MSSIRRLLWSVLLLGLVSGPVAIAQDGIVEDCEIESLDYEERQGRLFVSGRATCSEGRLELTIFDDESGEQIAKDFTYIMDNEFGLHVNASVPESIVIEYTIE